MHAVTIKIPDEACRDIMAKAAGASIYWLRDYSMLDCIIMNGRVESFRLGMIAGNDAVDLPAKEVTVTLVDIAKAIGRMCELKMIGDMGGALLDDLFGSISYGGSPTGPKSRAGSDADRPTCDAVLQVAVFGRLVYG